MSDYLPFSVTLVDFVRADASEFKDALRQAANSLRIAVRCQKSVSDASYPQAVVHAIVFAPKAIASVTEVDVHTIRSATDLGTCRVYLSGVAGTATLPEGSQLDEFIQQTQVYGNSAVAKEIVSFFRKANSLNRHSTPFAFRDMGFIAAYRILKYLWLVSYVFAAVHILNATIAIAGHGAWLGQYSKDYFLPASTFFGVFFINHCFFVVIRNWLFALRIAKRVTFSFVWGAVGLSIAAAATAYSVAVTSSNILNIAVNALIALAIYVFYMYARRIRSECTSLSQLQAAMADPQRREDVLKNIGEQRFGHSAFPLFPFQHRALFISYMHGSQWSSDTAALIEQWASKYSFEVFLDRFIPSGSLWRQSLLRAVSESGFFIAVIDGESPITEWVLAESAYAALLRKSIGKPRILLVLKNVQQIAGERHNFFRLLYLDVFQLPPAHCFGAGILPVDADHPLTEEGLFKALEVVRPMCLLS